MYTIERVSNGWIVGEAFYQVGHIGKLYSKIHVYHTIEQLSTGIEEILKQVVKDETTKIE